MKTRQLQQLRACRASYAVLQKYSSVWEENAGFVRLVGVIRGSIARVGTLLGFQEGDRSGFAKQKSKLRVDALSP
jgi:hypothetical protein